MDHLSKETRSLLMSRIRTKHTSIEIRVRSLVHRMGFRFRLHRKDLPGSPDVVFPSRQKVIFINGCFWHGHTCRRGKLPATNAAFWKEKITGNQKRDAHNLAALKKLKWTALVLWECDLLDETNLKSRLAE